MDTSLIAHSLLYTFIYTNSVYVILDMCLRCESKNVTYCIAGVGNMVKKLHYEMYAGACMCVAGDSSVTCCSRFLERQLLAQRAEWEQDKLVLTQQLQEAHTRDAPVSEELKVIICINFTHSFSSPESFCSETGSSALKPIPIVLAFWVDDCVFRS